MPSGGRRAGAGRKKGSATKRTREIADRITKDGGVTPLDVMLFTMRHLHDVGRHIEAAEIAAKAAPYIHARLSSVEHKGTDGQALIPKTIEVLFVKPPQSAS